MNVISRTLSVLGICAFAAIANGREVKLSDWMFSRNGGPAERVRVPHDWAISGPFDPFAPGGTGKLPWIADGVYTAKFVLDEVPAHARLEFDGVMADPEVFVNGVSVGGWDYGYVSFWCDFTHVARKGENVVVVKASTRHLQSRWYPGGGIYREVKLVTDEADYVVPSSVFIRANLDENNRATVTASWRMSLSGEKTKTFTVFEPRLWDVNDPFLYKIQIGGKTYRYGIRKFEWTVDDGFHLNGRRVQIKGVNLHSDLGPLGMAFDVDAARRQLLIMKDMGVNAVRTAHNAPASQFLDLCDEMGFLVWDECFDKWNETAGRRPGQNLEDFVVRNLKRFVERDRNHPSVVCWSVSNEIAPKGTIWGGADGQSRERNKLFRDTVRKLDPTRPVTAGLASLSLLDSDCVADLDLQGWNYEHTYAAARAKYPSVAFVYSESASALSSRGFYRIPQTRGKTDFPEDIRQVDGYDLTSAWCGDIPDVEFNRIDNDRYVAGEFIWTGIDYIGEPNPFTYMGRPDCWPGPQVSEDTKPRSSYFGAVDLCCLPKDRFWLYRSLWNKNAETVHILPHWNWEGNKAALERGVPVVVYTSGDSAELFLNGRSLGRRTKLKNLPSYSLDFAGRNPPIGDVATNAYYAVCAKYRLRWEDVPYEPGELRVVATREGCKIAEAVVRTASEPARIVLSEDLYTPLGSKMAFIKVSVADSSGVQCPLDSREVFFSVEGDAEIVAVCNGNAMDFSSFEDVSSHRLFNGAAVLYVRRGRGKSVLTASAPGLAPCSFGL
ncbi:MAG: DUF4982 domain-containing protein [Kiritimatiellae bacterium]|nr:DUF4982 domain-containing protein [Kiritimatiellia bacterium]